MSAFVTKLINQAIEAKKKALTKAYIEAAQDEERDILFDEWSTTDTGDWEW